MKKILKPAFFKRNALKVAKDLVGKYIVRENVGYKIIESEAYDGEKDLACHASKGRTKRTEVLYAEGGHLYVYLIYGMHYLLNVVADKKDYPAGVLIRGIETKERKIFGPGRVAKFLKIDKAFHGAKPGRKMKLWFEDRGDEVEKIKKTPRIGIDFAGPVWSKKLYRFLIVK